MATVAELLAEQRAQDEMTIQSALGNAIQQSFAAIIHEPLGDRIALLLLQLALDKVVNPVSDDGRKEDTSAPTDQSEIEIDKATRHIAGAKRLVAQQRERIVRLQRERCPIEDAMQILNTFIETLAAMEHRQRLLCGEAEHKKPIGSFQV